ncbi:4-hydroxythreonine-4-phosphate dehydrogenase PdxA [Ciceribacter sp. L1K23]|uniref:4-hydroxythreonine-4-phosphate dehydrogenase PdxA n=1 Tax=Ciceribacter sp. L1K23 TaxID=2820276 RepID=UPI001B83AA8C|nr:4-hydroxythreonine-4-phosphate dehydrogenase PdxA [Ciceribacter sp. L1K23]MBR0556145.1 4-hydroxythreonine-4-phosphate dehydrogenase PdxA [Ciceribacter sp. L1K23]
MAASSDRPLALTQGDPAGIGPDIALVAWSQRREKAIPPFIYIGDPAVLAVRARQLELDVPIHETDVNETTAVFDGAMPVLPLRGGIDVVAGQPHVATAKTTIAAIETAVALCMEDKMRGVVTNPIAKSVLYESGFKFPGHTEFLADLASRRTNEAYRPVMMLAGPKLRAVPVTVHIPLKDVPGSLTEHAIVETCRIVSADLKARFGLASPRLAVAGLNPHAGEGGALGTEDEDIVHAAVMKVRDLGIDAFGPLPADTMFHDDARRRYDVAVCMYHDQALIPVKALDFDESVNVTLGLPFVRTSPDHGTAFGLAGTGIARPNSLIAALKLADSITGRTVATS